MNEFQAALGSLQLKYIDEAILRRRQIDTYYREALVDIPGISILPLPEGSDHNYSYFPILVEQDFSLSRDELYQKFKDNDIFVRRYFYPLISQFPMYRGLSSAATKNLPVASLISNKVICLPIYPDLLDDDVELVVSIIKSVI